MNRTMDDDASRTIRCENVQWLLDHHEYPNRIARRLGCDRLQNLTDQLRRWGRQDLVDRLLDGLDARVNA